MTTTSTSTQNIFFQSGMFGFQSPRHIDEWSISTIYPTAKKVNMTQTSGKTAGKPLHK